MGMSIYAAAERDDSSLSRVLGCRWIANQFHRDTFCQSMHKRLWKALDARTKAAPAVKMPSSVFDVLKRS